MKSTAMLKLVSAVMALVLSAASGFTIAAAEIQPSDQSPAVALYVFPEDPSQTTDNPVDCKKTPKDPRCTDKK
jgi:hypothetical protein